MFTRLHAKCLRWLRGKFDSKQFTYDELKKMFIPLLLDQLFIFSIGMLSTAMVSSSGEGAMTAVNYGGTIGMFTYALHSALALGGGIVIARAKGAGNGLRIREATGQCCVMCTVFGGLVGLCSSVFAMPLLKLFYSSADEQILEMAASYLRIYGLSVIPYTLFNVIFTVFRSIGDTKGSLILTLIINSVHLICSLIYINVLQMGVAGSALSYLTARVIGMVFGMYWMMRKKCTLGMQWRDFFAYDKETAKDVVKLGVPLSIEQVLFQGGMLMVSMYLSKRPIFETDAHGVANSMFMLYYVFAYSLMNMTTTVCGQCVGAKDITLAKRYCKNITDVGRIILLIAVLILFPTTPLLLKLYSPSADSVKYIYIALAIGALPMPLIWNTSFLPASLTRAAGDATFTTVVSLTALLFGRMAVGYVLTIVLGLGMPGVWIGQFVEWIYRSVILHIRVKGTNWIKVDLSKHITEV